MQNEKYPTEKTIDDWDGPSLFAVTGERACQRLQQNGLESLNEHERVSACLLIFDGDVNNGGMGAWLCQNHPQIIHLTVPSLKTIEARPMAAFVSRILRDLNDLEKYTTLEEWQDYIDSLPDEFHEELETLSSEFPELEPAFLESAYDFARSNWQHVREP